MDEVRIVGTPSSLLIPSVATTLPHTPRCAAALLQETEGVPKGVLAVSDDVELVRRIASSRMQQHGGRTGTSLKQSRHWAVADIACIPRCSKLRFASAMPLPCS